MNGIHGYEFPSLSLNPALLAQVIGYLCKYKKRNGDTKKKNCHVCDDGKTKNHGDMMRKGRPSWGCPCKVSNGRSLKKEEEEQRSGQVLYETDSIVFTLHSTTHSVYQISSELLTSSVVGVFGTMRFMRLRSSLVTKPGVMGTQGVNG